MTWYMIRLDLARSPEMPQGSNAVSYLLRLPLDDIGMIDAKALAVSPGRASVLRSLPDAPEVNGHVLARDDGWIFSYAPGDGDDEALLHPEVHPFRPGGYCSIRGDDEQPRTFRISACTPLVEHSAQNTATAN